MRTLTTALVCGVALAVCGCRTVNTTVYSFPNVSQKDSTQTSSIPTPVTQQKTVEITPKTNATLPLK